MAVQSVSQDRTALINSLNGAQAANGVQAGSIQEVQDRFLKLLVAQMQNQDPMNPMENAELTSQLAQMSTVEGVNKLNESFSTMVSSYKASQALQASGLLGHQVLVSGNELDLNDGLAGGGFELDGTSTNTHVLVKNLNGAVVRDLDLGRQEAGMVRFAWDGQNNAGQEMPNGNYVFEVQALTGNQAVNASTFSLGEVLSVTLNNSDVSIETNHRSAISLTDVKQIY